jgi:hypothetical protein
MLPVTERDLFKEIYGAIQAGASFVIQGLTNPERHLSFGVSWKKPKEKRDESVVRFSTMTDIARTDCHL